MKKVSYYIDIINIMCLNNKSMKKSIVLAISIGIISMFLAVSSFAEDTALKVIAKNGQVSVKVYPSDKWTELTLGQMVHSKDMIKTDICDVHSKDKESKFVDAEGHQCPICGAATLELPDKTSVSLKPGTEISIEDFVLSNAARKLKVNMTKGELRMMITKVNTQSDFSVKTPNAIYGATGTVFYVSVTPTGTSVYVSENSVNVFNPINGQTYAVVAGSMMTFNIDGTFAGPAPASDVDVSNWTACYTTPTAEPYTPPIVTRPTVTPPNNTPERQVSGG